MKAITLLSEHTLQFVPRLAVLVGNSDRAIILRQLYWLCRQQGMGKMINGHRYYYGTYADIGYHNFQHLSAEAIRKHISKLESDGFVISIQPYKNKGNMIKYYRVDEDYLTTVDIPQTWYEINNFEPEPIDEIILTDEQPDDVPATKTDDIDHSDDLTTWVEGDRTNVPHGRTNVPHGRTNVPIHITKDHTKISNQECVLLGTSSAGDAQNTHTPSADSENQQSEEQTELLVDESIAVAQTVDAQTDVDPNQLLQDVATKTTMQHSAEMYPGASMAQLQRMNRYATGEAVQGSAHVDPLLAKWQAKGITAQDWSAMIQEVANRTGVAAMIELQESDFADRKLNDIKSFLDSLLQYGRRFWLPLGVAMLFDSYAANEKFADPKFSQLLEHASKMVAGMTKRQFAVIDGAVKEVDPEAEAKAAAEAKELERRKRAAAKRKAEADRRTQEDMIRETTARRKRIEAAEAAAAAKAAAKNAA